MWFINIDASMEDKLTAIIAGGQETDKLALMLME